MPLPRARHPPLAGCAPEGSACIAARIHRMRGMATTSPSVLVIMGSKSDWETMRSSVETLDSLGIANEAHVASAHRTPELVAKLTAGAEARGVKVIIAAAGGAAHLAGVIAAQTWLPVLGVPMKAWSLDGLDSLLSMVQMPAGIPVGTLAIGKAGAKNAALLAAAIIALDDAKVREALLAFRKKQSEEAADVTLE
jgi:5-(carboxyamino)imidazole ribonucleotide mutase